MGTYETVKVPLGEGWQHLARAAARDIPVEEIDGVWTFRALRQDQREWGTAVLSRVDGDRRRIYTARYVHTIKGKERGKYSAVVEEVGSGPVEALEELIRNVEKRAGEEMPDPVEVSRWFAGVEQDAGSPQA